jgi:enoyl-CoA hydratase
MEHILFEKIDHVGRVTLNRPQALNALSQDLIRELNQALALCEADPEIHCVILTGSEKVFSVGADLKEIQGKTSAELKQNDFIKDWEKVSAFPKPIIAAVSGYALGGGCEIALMCDFIVASESAKFGQPEVTIGTMPGAGATQRLARLLGKAKTMELCLTGRLIDAFEAEKIGLVSHVVPLEHWADDTLKIAQKIASYSLPVLMMIKESVTRAFEVPLAEGLKCERQLFQSTFDLEDQKEGFAAFLEKRKPEFRGW